VVGFDDALDRGQTQPEALLPAGLRPPIKDFEEMGQVCRRDAGPLVFNAEQRLGRLRLDLQDHCGVGGAVFDGILQQVFQDPRE
jgi:hypothetical protein